MVLANVTFLLGLILSLQAYEQDIWKMVSGLGTLFPTP